MAVIIETKTRNHINNPFFTDETQYLTGYYQDSGQPLVNGTREPDKLYYGMSFYEPAHLLDYDMVIPFQEIEFRELNESDNSISLIYTINWDISPYHNALRSALSEFNESKIYFYAKALSPNGHEYISWQLCNITIIDEKRPIYTLSPSYTVTDSLTLRITGSDSIIIRYVSDVNVKFTAEAQKGSTLVSYTVKNGSKSINSTSILNQTSAVISQDMTNIESSTFYVSVEDSRGMRTNDFVQANLIDYFYPTCHLAIEGVSAARGSTLLTISGLAYNGYLGVTNDSLNGINPQYRYKAESDDTFSDWISFPEDAIREGDKYTASTTVSGLDYKTKYIFEGRVTDAITTVLSTDIVAKSSTVFDWGKEDFRFNVPVNIDGDLTVNGFVNSANGSYEQGVWTPECNMVSNPDYAVGYYTRIGDVCTINFYFEGEIDVVPQQNVFLCFTGLPFIPDSSLRWQAGGGNCTGYARHTGGSSRGVNYSYHAFSGWSIENGCIYGRMSSWASVEGNSYREDLGSGHYQNYKTADTARYITGVIGDTFYASGTISYKIEN